MDPLVYKSLDIRGNSIELQLSAWTGLKTRILHSESFSQPTSSSSSRKMCRRCANFQTLEETFRRCGLWEGWRYGRLDAEEWAIRLLPCIWGSNSQSYWPTLRGPVQSPLVGNGPCSSSLLQRVSKVPPPLCFWTGENFQVGFGKCR